MNIRPATLHDAAKLLSLNHEVQQLHSDALPEFFKPSSFTDDAIEAFSRQLQTNGHYFYIAEDAEPLGYIYAQHVSKPENWMRPQYEYIVINHIIVRSTERRKGVGRQLIDRAFLLADDIGVERIEIDFWAFNTQAQHFFMSQGFATFHSRMHTRRRANTAEQGAAANP